MPLPAPQVDAELNRVKRTFDATLANLAKIQRDDGAVMNWSIGFDQLKPEINGFGASIPTAWKTATNYIARQTVYNGPKGYVCNVDHVSDVFAKDLAGGKWTLFVDLTAGIGTATRVHKLVNTANIDGLFTGWGGANQGLAHIEVNGQRKLFMSLAVGGATYATNERIRIVEFNVTDDGAALVPVSYSQELNSGHGQDIGAELVGDAIYIWTTSTTTVNDTGAGKGFNRIEWKGSATAQADITTYLVFGASGSGHRYEKFYQGSTTISDDGKYLIIVPEDIDADREHKVFIYDKSEILLAGPGGSLAVDPVFSWTLPTSNHAEGRIVQGVHSANDYVNILTGFYNPNGWTEIKQFAIQTGELDAPIPICPIQQELGYGEIVNSATYSGYRLEAEGVCGYNDELLVGYYENRYTGGSVVSFEGSNHAFIGPDSSVSPHQMFYWQRSLKTASGPYNSATTYTAGTVALHRKSIWSIRPPRGEAGETPISPLKFANESSVPSAFDDEVQQIFKIGQGWALKAYSEALDTYYNAVRYNDGQMRLYDMRIGADNSEYAVWERSSSDGLAVLRAKTDLVGGAGINLYDTDNATAAGQVRIYAVDPTGPTLRTLFFRGSSPAFYGVNQEISLGLRNLAWRDVVTAKTSFVDGLAAPATVSGLAQSYVDTADKGFKIHFGDGQVNSIIHRGLVGWIGDSITAAVGASSAADGYVAKAVERLGCRSLNWAVAGAQMSPTTAPTTPEKNGSLTNIVGTQAANIALCEMVVIALGTNDWSRSTAMGTLGNTGPTTFYGAMADGYAAIIAANPACKVVFMQPIFRSVSGANSAENVSNNSITLALSAYRTAIAAFAAAKKLTVVNTYSELGITSDNILNLSGDGLHPNNAGHGAMGRYVARALR